MTQSQQLGLSILIPIYNFDCRQLVSYLHKQCQEIDFPFEILCLDDASETSFQILNQALAKESKTIHYISLEQNVGRSHIRNLLAEQAQFDYLLFMDCDSKVVRSDYIKQYIVKLDSSTLLY
ncbi:MAG: glycosyltransferase family A protein, partial [Bacteroidota bacterium]